MENKLWLEIEQVDWSVSQRYWNQGKCETSKRYELGGIKFTIALVLVFFTASTAKTMRLFTPRTTTAYHIQSHKPMTHTASVSAFQSNITKPKIFPRTEPSCISMLVFYCSFFVLCATWYYDNKNLRIIKQCFNPIKWWT